MVRNVAVQQPSARLAGGPDDVVALPRSDVDGVGVEPGGGSQWDAVDRGDGKRAAVDVHWVDETVTGADEPHQQPLPYPHPDGVGGGVGLAVDGEEVR
ncbi:hypothetical protein AAH979_40985 [Plantactinospora sp. ZYX-F-223]|uniref:hypothetical protein n=1 Tax=Plantactinospora sp. ZYX-F-223 TaxID=3144103 RepID=UPI0031FD6A00